MSCFGSENGNFYNFLTNEKRVDGASKRKLRP
jgi:hypothetical protein